MNILLLRPRHPGFGINYFDHIQNHILKSLLSKKYNVSIKYLSSKNAKIKQNYDLIIINFSTSYANFSYKIADELRKKGIPVIFGGWHPSALPNEAKKHADSVVIGEAESLLPEVLKDFENGDLKSFYKQKKPFDLNKTPLVNSKDLSSFPKKYIVELSRGCSIGCSHCTIGQIKFSNIVRTKDIDRVIEEIRPIKKYLCFYDLGLSINPDYLKKLFIEIKNLNKSFSIYGDIKLLDEYPELIKLSKQAGCKQWLLGFETILQENIDEIGKSRNKVKDYPNIINKIHNNEMTVKGNFIFGFNNDNENIFNKTLEKINKWEIDAAEFNILLPIPGTPLFEKFDKENRIITYDWSKYDYGNLVYQPKNMTKKELIEGYKWIIKKYYSELSLLKRTIRLFKKFDFDVSMNCIKTNYNLKRFHKKMIK